MTKNLIISASLFLLLMSCNKNNLSDADYLLSDNAKTYFHYKGHYDQIFYDPDGNAIRFSPDGSPETGVFNFCERRYIGFRDESGRFLMSFELCARPNHLHFVRIGFIEKDTIGFWISNKYFCALTDTNMIFGDFITADTTFRQDYQSLQLNDVNYQDVIKLWKNFKGRVDTVFFNRHQGVVGFVDEDNKMWNLK